MNAPAGELEWLETNRQGSFALHCVDRRMRRKYHALLCVREPGHGDPWNVLADVRERVTSAAGSRLLCDPLGHEPSFELVGFEQRPHAMHRYRGLDVEVDRRVKLAADHDQVELHYRVRGVKAPLRLELEPWLRCRPWHELTHENPFLDGSLTLVEGEHRMLPYAGMPGLALRVDGSAAELVEQGTWHRHLFYPWEADRGYDAHEDLFSPGRFVIELTGDAELTLILGLDHTVPPQPQPGSRAPLFAAKLERALAAFSMRTRAGVDSVVAGYPWFGAWARDTLIALPGMYLATQNFEYVAGVLDGLLAARINGLIPNIPALAGSAANTSSVDASLLFVRAVQWLGDRAGSDRVLRFMPAVCELLEALAERRDPRMGMDDGVGVRTRPGPWALTWMDAVVGGQPVTPRAGYTVEVDALAYNAARFAQSWAQTHRPQFGRAWAHRLLRAEERFVGRYWSESRGFLADAHDGERPDPALRPNQLWALALPFRAVTFDMARASLTAINRELVVPAGLRSLAPSHPAYKAVCAGAQPERDRAYHQGGVWPWLLGIYSDALRLTLGAAIMRAQLAPVLAFFTHHLDAEGCLGQVSEVFDGAAPHTARGAPAQAWSASELYRVWRMLHEAA